MKIGFDFDGVISHVGRLKSDGARKIYGELISVARTIEIISYDRYPVIIKKSSTENKIDVTNFVKWGGDLHRLLGVQRRS